MPAFCSICASEDYTSEGETGDGRLFAICSAAYHGDEPYVWEPAPPTGRNTRGDGLGNDLDIWDKLLECVPEGGAHSYGVVEDQLFELYPSDAAAVQERYGHRWRDGKRSESPFSMSAYFAARLSELAAEGVLIKSFAPAQGEWAYNGIISRWAKP